MRRGQWTIERQVISDFRFELLKCIGELWSCLSSQCNGKECVAPLLFVFVYNLFFVFLWLLPLYFITEELSSCMPGLVVNCGIIDCCICFCFCFCICLNFVFVFLWLLPLYFIAEELSPRMPGLVAPTVIGLIFTTRHLLYHSYTCGPLSSNSKSNNATLVLRLVHMCFRIWIWVCSTSSRWCASCSTQWFFCQLPRWLTILCILLLKVFFVSYGT